MTWSQPLTDYERRRLENIKRNQEMMSAFKIHSGATSELFSSSKRHRIETKSYNKIPKEKKPKSDHQNPIVIRRSLRTRGIPPDSTTTKEGSSGEEEGDRIASSVTTNDAKSTIRELGPVLSIRDAYVSKGSSSTFDDKKQQNFIHTIKGLSEKNPSSLTGCSISQERDDDGVGGGGDSVLDLRSLVLKPENIRRLMPGAISQVKFFPCKDRSLIVAGNLDGNVAFWDVDGNMKDREEEGDNDIYLYRPHTGPITGITIRPLSISKVYTSSYDGCIHFLDIEKESFDLVYYSKKAIFCLSHHPHEEKSLYFGVARGVINVWDERAGKSSSSWALHDERINTIDFHPENTNLMATSSTDGTACIWDLRSINANRPKTLKIVDHKSSVYSAYFSPSGSCLATTCASNKVGLLRSLRGVDFTDISMIDHGNQVGYHSRASWGWNDYCLFIGTKSRGVDVISTSYGAKVTLESPYISAIPREFAAHPYNVGMLAGATTGGQVYVWLSQEV